MTKKFKSVRFLIAIQPPEPPTAPAPAIRPKPPTPPRIDRQIDNDQPKIQQKSDEKPVQAEKSVEKPVEKPIEKPAEEIIVIPPDAPLIYDEKNDYDRGKDVLREFEELDAANSPKISTEQTLSEPTNQIVPKIPQNDSHGAFYWLFTIIFVSLAAFFVVKKFLLTDKPKLTKNELFADSSSKLKAATDKIKPAPPKSDEKGKNFEIRV